MSYINIKLKEAYFLPNSWKHYKIENILLLTLHHQ